MHPSCGTFSVPLPCRYYLHAPGTPSAPDPILFLALHGYGSNPIDMLRLTSALVGPGQIVLSLQAPFQHYSGQPGTSVAGYNWGIRDHHAEAVEIHHEMVQRLIRIGGERFRIPPGRCVLAGFSQPVGLNYRFAGTFPDLLGGIIALCGGVPRDWEEPKYQSVTAPILHIARSEDEFFPVETAERFPDRLRVHAPDVEFHMLPGAHRFPSKASSIVRPWLRRVFGAGCGIE